VGEKQTATNIDSDLHARARAAVRLVKASGQRYTLAQFLREAITAQLRVIADDYNQGRPIAPDVDPLPPGRVG